LTPDPAATGTAPDRLLVADMQAQAAEAHLLGFADDNESLLATNL
jgi:hypothetical protein